MWISRRSTMWWRVLVLTVLVAQPTTGLADSLPSIPEVIDPRTLLPSDAEVPVGFQRQPGSDVDIVGSTWADSCRLYQRGSADRLTVDAASLYLRVRVHAPQPTPRTGCVSPRGA
jgi:hypothetical protein